MPVRLRLGSRRLPWPNDMRVGPFGVDLVADQAGVALYSKKAIPFEQVDPAVFDYAGSEPYRERTFVFRNPFQGVGQYLQIGQAPTRRSMECLDVDTSLGFAIKGPFTHRIDPAHTGSIAEFVEGYYQGSLNLFALCGQYVNVMNTDAHEPDSDSDDAIQVLDLGAGILATQGVRFRGTGGGDVDALYVANTGTHVKQYASDAWHDCAFPAQAIDVRREELWFGYQNKVRKVEADPTSAGDFAAAIAIGDASTNITWISHVLDGLVIFKTAGIYSLNVDLAAGSVLDTDLWPHLAIARDDNGKGANVWLGNQMFASFGNALWRITPQIAFSQVTSLDIAPVALNVNEIPDSLAFGRPVVTAGHNDWWNYVAMYNQQTGKSYLGKYGSWITPDIAGGQATTFVQGFHCAIREFTGQITAMKIWGRVGEPERLWIGFADGHIEWAWLSQVSRNPVNESVENGGRCEFVVGDGYVRWPKFNAGFEGITKWLKGFSAFGPVISSWNRVQQQYRNSPGASWSQLVDDFINAGERHDVAAVELGQELDTRTILHNESIYSTPVLEGVGLHFQIRPEQTYEHTGVFEAHAAASARNGTVGLDSADAIRAYLRDTMETRGSVTCYLPDESKQELLFLDHAENLKARNRSTGREWDMPFRAVQFESVLEIGTFRRLGKWTFRQLGKVRMKGLVKI